MTGNFLISLPTNEIHVWLESDRVPDEIAAGYRLLLRPNEKQKEQTFHFEDDRVRYLVTRALIRVVLSRYEPVGPKDWVFSTNAYGRPEINYSIMGKSDLCFNVSHTAGLITLAVTRGRALGIDVENASLHENPQHIAKQVLAATEFADLLKLPAESQIDRFFQYWTLKEAYIKARGLGVSIPLHKFSVHLEQEGLVELELSRDLADDQFRWQLWQFRLAPKYLIAICAERGDHLSPTILVKRRALLGGEEAIPVQFDRVSP